MSEKPKRKAAKAPVSAHPAFPAIVGLWFAALLGMGSFVLPVALFENLSTSSGLSSMIVAAQPPLGVTARILIALAAAGVGAVGGLFVARRIVASHAPRPQSQRAAAISKKAAFGAAASTKKPISAREEFGEDGIDADEVERDTVPARRRALAVHDESARSELLDLAPLPGIDPYAAPEPLDLGDFRAGVNGEPVAVAQHHEWEVGDSFGTSGMSGRPLDDTYRPVCDTHPVTAAPEVITERREEPTMSQPDLSNPSFAPSFAATIADEPRFDRPVDATPVPETPAHAAATAPDSIVNLVDRFARALERRREMASAAHGQAEQAAPMIDLTFALGAKSPVEQPVPFSESKAPTFHTPPMPFVPPALQPLRFESDMDDDDEEGALPTFSLPLANAAADRPFAAPTAFAPVADDAADSFAEEPAEENYPSLLAMKSPFGLPREPVRIDDGDDGEGLAIEPVVVFPGQAARRGAPASDGPVRDAATPSFGTAGLRPFDGPAGRFEAKPASAPAANPGSTEQALRDALDKLQRMSGAA